MSTSKAYWAKYPYSSFRQRGILSTDQRRGRRTYAYYDAPILTTGRILKARRYDRKRKFATGGNVNFAQTEAEKSLGLIAGKNGFRFDHNGPHLMTMNPLGYSIPFPVSYQGFSKGQLVDSGIAYPGHDFIVQGDTVVETPVLQSDGKYPKNMNNKYKNPVLFPITTLYSFQEGGGIHIKKENRGKFTAQAKRAGMGVQEFARHVLLDKNKNRYSAATRKRANFARNFGGRKEMGGYIQDPTQYPDIVMFKKGGFPQKYKSMGFSGIDKPKRTPSHPTKSHAVVVKDGGSYKLIRFGQQGVKGSPKKSGESESYRNRRNSFKARHAKNISKGKTSAAYWANKVKWQEGGQLEPLQPINVIPQSMAQQYVPDFWYAGTHPNVSVMPSENMSWYNKPPIYFRDVQSAPVILPNQSLAEISDSAGTQELSPVDFDSYTPYSNDSSFDNVDSNANNPDTGKQRPSVNTLKWFDFPIASTAYNVYQGMNPEKEMPYMNQNAGQSLGLLKSLRYSPNYRPMYLTANRLESNIRDASSTPSAMIANMQNAWSNVQNLMSDTDRQAQQINNQYAAAYAQALMQEGAARAAERARVGDRNIRHKAASRAHTAAALRSVDQFNAQRRAMQQADLQNRILLASLKTKYPNAPLQDLVKLLPEYSDILTTE